MIEKSKQNEILRIVEQCGINIISSGFESSAAHTVTAKDGTANFVTDVDVAAEEYLIRELSAVIPESVFFAEEKNNDAVVFDDKFCFMIDPLDGTTNFMHSMGCSAVSVGLLYNGKVIFGAVYDPYRKEMFHATAGEGAYLNGRAIRVSDRRIEKSLISFGTSPYNRAEYCDSTFERVKRVFNACADIRRNGSASLDVCYVACGRTDAYFEDFLSPWDYSAGMLILTEAGGMLTTFGGEIPAAGEKTSVLCTNGALHQTMLRLLNQ